MARADAPMHKSELRYCRHGRGDRFRFLFFF